MAHIETWYCRADDPDGTTIDMEIHGSSKEALAFQQNPRAPRMRKGEIQPVDVASMIQIDTMTREVRPVRGVETADQIRSLFDPILSTKFPNWRFVVHEKEQASNGSNHSRTVVPALADI